MTNHYKPISVHYISDIFSVATSAYLTGNGPLPIKENSFLSNSSEALCTLQETQNSPKIGVC